MKEFFAKERRGRKLGLALLILGLGLLSITTRSLWHDEISHAQNIVRDDFGATLGSGLAYGKLGYLLIEYLWAALLGPHTGEFALRSSNLVFSALAIFYAFRIVEAKRWPLWSCLLFFVHPMYVYYMNEVTPYILLYAVALGFTYHVFLRGDAFSSVGNIVAINALFLFGVFVHFIFGFAVLLYFAKCFLTIRRERRLVLRHAGIMLAFGVGYLPMLYLILRYMNGTATGFSVLNPLYVIYCFLGMAGLGVPRGELKLRNFASITPGQILLLGAFALVSLAILALAICRSRGFLKRNQELLAALAVYFIVLILVAIPMHFGMWERHCIVVFPVYMLLFADLMLELCGDGRRLGRLLYALFFLLLLVSCARLRFDAAYVRDDFKGLYADLAEKLQTNDDLKILLQRVNGYYTLDGALTSPEQEIVNLDQMEPSEIYSCFMERVNRGEDVALVLFSTFTTPQAYAYFDTQPNFTTDTTHPSFKIVRPAG